MDGGTQNKPQAPWKFSDDTSAQADVAADNIAPSERGAEETVEWTASEFIAHNKSANWYALLVLGVLIIVALVYLLTKDVASVIAVGIICIFAGVVSTRQPKTLPYRLDKRGLSIGHRFYAYTSFKSFYVIDEGAFSNITLKPSGGIMPELSIYYAPEDEPQILEVLGTHLPMEQSNGSLVDRFARRIHF